MRRNLRDAALLLAPAVAKTLDGLQPAPEDDGAAALARLYAAIIDTSDQHCAGCDDPDCKRASTAGWAARWIGPLLLDALESLGATAAARARIKTGAPPAGPGRLQALRDASRRG